jgi:riboflavin transporter FmnP
MKITTKNLTLSGLFIALGLYMPFLTAQVPSIGSRLLPMHIPVLISGFVLGWPYGLIIGLITPVFRSVLFGMPPMIPTALAMSFELAAYGAITGLLYRLLPKKDVYTLVTLVIAMIVGRIVWGTASYLIFGLSGRTFTWQLLVANGFVNAIPGIILQLFAIPLLVVALKRARLIQNV